MFVSYISRWRQDLGFFKGWHKRIARLENFWVGYCNGLIFAHALVLLEDSIDVSVTLFLHPPSLGNVLLYRLNEQLLLLYVRLEARRGDRLLMGRGRILLAREKRSCVSNTCLGCKWTQQNTLLNDWSLCTSPRSSTSDLIRNLLAVCIRHVLWCVLRQKKFLKRVILLFRNQLTIAAELNQTFSETRWSLLKALIGSFRCQWPFEAL